MVDGKLINFNGNSIMTNFLEQCSRSSGAQIDLPGRLVLRLMHGLPQSQLDCLIT